jgi:hypothetical protein
MKTPPKTNPVSRSPLRCGFLLIRLVLVTGLAVFTALLVMLGIVRGQVQGGDLFVTNNLGGFCGNGGSSIYQYTPQYVPPNGTPTIFASNLAAPRGLAFDSGGNLYVATNSADDSCIVEGTIFKITTDGLMSTLASGFGTNTILSGLAIDSAGNIFVMTIPGSNIGPSVIYKISPPPPDGDGTISTFGSVPGSFGMGLAFDGPGNLYAADPDDGIYKFTPAGAPYEPTPTGTPGVFASLDKFSSPQGPFGLVFDSVGNLFVSSASGNYGNGEILEFAYPDWTESTIATGLTKVPKGVALDNAGNLFVAEVGLAGITGPGDMLEFTPGGTGTVEGISLASGWGVTYLDQANFGTLGNRGPEWLAFTTGAVTPPSSAVALTFADATAPGTTTVTSIDPGSVGPLPSEFELSDSVGFEITTTVTYTPPIIIAFQVSPDLYALGLGVLHSECGNSGQSCTEGCTEGCTLVPRAILPGDPGYPSNPAPDTIYASVSSLSPFVVAKLKFKAQVQQPINADGTSVFTVRRGVVPVKFTLSDDGTSTCALPPATIAVTRTSGGTTGAIDESVYSGSADTGSNFRINSCQYAYNLIASALGVGTYRVDIKINGQVVGSGIFALK